MRLIDADALAKKLGMASKCEDCPNCTQIKFCGLSQELMEVCDAIEDAPTIDPVKHGMWEPVGSTIMGDSFGELAWGKMYRCSECGFVRHVIKDSEHYKFCPNCGADMRGEYETN